MIDNTTWGDYEQHSGLCALQEDLQTDSFEEKTDSDCTRSTPLCCMHTFTSI